MGPANEKEALVPAKLTPMAIIYDFDGTLAPGNVQEHQFIPGIGMTAADFWEEVNTIAKTEQADPILMYMHLMLKKAQDADIPVHREDFRQKGKGVKLFDGVEGWFGRIKEYAKGVRVRIEHHIVSSGNAEIIEGTSIARNFKKIYASRFIFDRHGAAFWPAIAINYTTKTQFLFRINKGAHDLSNEEEVNRFVEKKNRPIPFENMIYIGDGQTDIPCFRLVKDLGGLSIAIYPPRASGAHEKAKGFLNDGRVQTVVPAIYQENSKLDAVVKAQIDFVAARAKRESLLGS